MESLLASYGSDDEEDAQQPAPPLPAFRSQAPLFASLPPPHAPASAHSSSIRSSLFASLPRPRSASRGQENTSKQEIRFAEEEIRFAEEEIRVSNGANRATDGTFRTADRTFRTADRASSDAGDAFRVADGAIRVSDGVARVAEMEAASLPQFGKRTSLFRALPPPKSSGSSSLPPKAQPSSSGASKRVVEFRPSINMALLQDPDDDDVQPQAKRHAMDAMALGKSTGLAAILPKPKNLGATLGSGHAPGHRATLEIGDAVKYSTSKSEGTSLETAPQQVHDSSSPWHGHAAETWDNHNHSAEVGASEIHVSSLAGTWENYGHDVGADLQRNVDTSQWATPSSASYDSSFVSQESSEVFASEGHYGMPNHQHQAVPAHEASSFTGSHQAMSNAEDTLANILMKERRKGGKDVPPNFIEVKQSDLTATKLREDQLRTTGIAFGPAYMPVSSNKGKPSKIHRRKHQIGSLYYDMKQKEMELLERRSRGNMTKSETQAKYGW